MNLKLWGGDYIIKPEYYGGEFTPENVIINSIEGDITHNFIVEFPTYTIQGTIKDIDDNPIKGSTVTLTGMTVTSTVNMVYYPTDDGKYEFGALTKGDYTISLQHIDASYTPPSIELDDLDSDQADQDFLLNITTYSITGTVEDGNGAGIANTTITLKGISSTGPLNIALLTESDGSYKFLNIFKGDYTLTPSPVYGTIDPESVPINDLSQDSVNNFTIDFESYLIYGKIEDYSFIPNRINGATLTLTGRSSTGPVNMEYFVTSNGWYEFSVIYGTYTITPVLDDGVFDPAIIVTPFITHGVDYDFHVYFPTNALTGTIKDADNNPVRGAEVRVTGTSSTGPVTMIYETGTGGTYEFYLYYGDYDITPSHPDASFNPVSVSTQGFSGDMVTDFTATFPTHKILGYIKDNQGNTINGSTLSLSGTSATGTVAMTAVVLYDGEYEFNLIYGDYTIEPEHDEGNFTPPVISTNNFSGNMSGDFIVHFDTYTIGGYVADNLGNRINGSTLTLTGQSSTGPVTMVYVPTSDGDFEFSVIHGSYTITPHHDGGVFTPLYVTNSSVQADVDYTFSVYFQTYTLSGTIEDSNSIEIKGSTLTLTGISVTGPVSILHYPGDDGEYEFTLIKGDYDLVPSHFEGIFTPSSRSFPNFASDYTYQDFELAISTYKITGIVKDDTGLGILDTTITLNGISSTGTVNRIAVTNGSGEYEFLNLYRGSYTLTATKLDGTFDPVYISSSDLSTDALDQDFEITFKKYLIAGFIDSSSVHVPDVNVVLSGISVTGPVNMTHLTLTDGFYDFEVIRGSYTVVPSKEDGTFTPNYKSYAEIDDDDVQDFEVSFVTYSITGVLKDLFGQDIENGTVTLTGISSTGSVSMTYLTGVDGTYSFEVIRGTYVLTPHYENSEFDVISKTYNDLGENKVQDFNVEYFIHAITGELKDGSGAGVSGATVTISGTSVTGPVTMVYYPESDGEYSFNVFESSYILTHGDYTITPTHNEITFDPVNYTTMSITGDIIKDFIAEVTSYTLTGYIKDNHGQAVEGSSVTLSGTSITGSVSVTYVPGSNGKFEFTFFKGNYSLVPFHMEGTFDPADISYQSLGSSLDFQDFTVTFDTYQVKGKIKDSNGAGIDGATVTLTGVSPVESINMSYLTSQDGEYEFINLIRGSYTIVASKEDGTFSPLYISSSDLSLNALDQDFEVEFQTYVITGKIKDSNGAGIINATVTLSGISPTGTVNLSYLTSQDGIYSFNLIKGSYTVTASKEDGAFSSGNYLSYSDLGSDQTDQDFEVEFSTYKISGLIEDSNGVDIENTTITLTGVSPTGTVSITYVTTSNGIYEFANIIRGSYTIVPSKEDGTFSPGYISYSDLDADQLSQNFTVGFPTYVIRGKIKDSNGNGIIDTTVTIAGLSATGSVSVEYITAQDGNYEFQLIRGSYTIELDHKYGSNDPAYISYPDLLSDELDQDFTINPSTYIITGNIKDPNGAGVTDVTVTLTGISPTGTVNLSYLTASDGGYEFEVVRGSYTVIGTKEDGTFTPNYITYQDITVDQLNQDFEVDFITYTIKGVITDSNGVSIADATITLSGISPTGTVNLTYITSGDGIYEFNLIRGSYTITGSKETADFSPDYRTYSDLNASALTEDYILEFSTYKITGIIEDNNGIALKDTVLTLTGVSSTGSVNLTYTTTDTGLYEFELILGSYTIIPTQDGVISPVSRTYTRLDNDETDQDFTVTLSTYLVSGVIRDSNDVTIAEATVTLTGISVTGSVSLTYFTDSSGAYEFELIKGSYTIIPAQDGTFSPAYTSYPDLDSDQVNQDFTVTFATHILRGMVAISYHETIANTTLTLTGISSTGPISATYVTGDDGSFEFELIKGSYTLVPNHIESSFHPSYISHPHLTHDRSSQNFLIIIETYSISGYIEDTENNRIDGSVLRLTGVSSTGPVNIPYIPIDNGEYEFQVIRGTYTITPEHYGGAFTPTSRSYLDIDSDYVDENYVVLFTSYMITGNIKDENDVAIIGATLTLTGTSTTSTISLTTLTTSSGTYEFMDIINGTYTLTAAYDEGIFSPSSFTYDDLTLSQLNQDFVVTFPTYTITGSIKDASGIGISGATFSLTGTTLIGGEVSKTFTTTSSGEYSFADIIKGSYEITPNHHVYITDPINITYSDLTSSQSSQDFVASYDIYSITGYLKDEEDNPIIGATITLTGASVTSTISLTYISTSSGEYSFTDLIYGDYSVTPRYEERSFIPYNRTYSPLAKIELDQNFEGDKNRYVISGYLKTTGNEVIKGATLTLTGTASTTYVTHDDGYYVLTGLLKGSYKVEPEHKDYTFLPASREYTEFIESQIAQTFEAEITTYTISGYVKDLEDLSVIENATVTLRVADSSNVVTSLTDANGYYEFNGLGGVYDYPDLQPLYQIVAYHKQYDFTPVHRNYESVYEDTLNQDFEGLGGVLEIEVTRLDFGEIVRGNAKVLAFKIANAGGGTLEGTIEADRDWIELSSTSFISNDIIIEVTIDTVVFEQDGTYTGIITVTSNGGTHIIDVYVLATCVLTKPNPYNPRSDGLLMFYGSGIVPYDTTINIFTISGEHVKTLKENIGSQEIPWDGKNENGDEVVTGIYIYTSKSPKEKWLGKFTILKKN